MSKKKVKVYHLIDQELYGSFCMDPDPYMAHKMFKAGNYEHVATILKSSTATNDIDPRLNEAFNLTSDDGWQYRKEVQCTALNPKNVRDTMMGDVLMLNRKIYLLDFKRWRNITNCY